MNGLNGIEKCRLLREIRRQVSVGNGLPFAEEDCPNESPDCRGTCPVCEMNLRRLNEMLEEQVRNGGVVSYECAKELYEKRRKS